MFPKTKEIPVQTLPIQECPRPENRAQGADLDKYNHFF